MEGLFRLPAELRTLIWQHALPGPQHVKFSARRHARLKTPVVFHICSESRAEAQRHYTLTPACLEIPCHCASTDDEAATHNEIWLNFSRDILCIDDHSDLAMSAPRKMSRTFARAQSLAFEFCAPQNFMQLLDILEPVHHRLSSAPDLREVVLYSTPKKWFEDAHTGRMEQRQPPLDDPKLAAKILLRLLHMLFGGHAWLDSGAGIPPPLRWAFVSNDEANVWAGPFPDEESYDYVFRCAATGKFEIQHLDWEQLGRLKRVQSTEPRVGVVVGCYEGCPEHHGKATDD